MANFVKIAWYGKHFGEEPPLIGNSKQGAGGIFFTGCNLKCVFCQNYQISQENLGKQYKIEELTSIMLELQKNNAINIDLITPTIWYKQIKEAIKIAKEKGLNIPIIWNSNAYENVQIIREMKGLIDIYLPDFKYANNNLALKYSGIKDYNEKAIIAIHEMLEQTGELIIKNNIAKKGIIIRHLILPNNIENSFKVLDEIAKINRNIYVSLMSQYNPIYKANLYPEINRKLYQEEFNKVYNYLLELELNNGWHQELDSSNIFVPDFNKINPF
jgi:putative pyruvate formate lyase activating enzyme